MHTHSIIHSHTHKYARIYKQRDCTYAGMILTCIDVSLFSLCLSLPPHLPVFSLVHAPTHALCNLSPHSSCSVCSGLFVALHTTPSSHHESPVMKAQRSVGNCLKMYKRTMRKPATTGLCCAGIVKRIYFVVCNATSQH